MPTVRQVWCWVAGCGSVRVFNGNYISMGELKMSEVKAFFDGLASSVDASKIAGMSAVYQFNLGDAVYAIAVADSALTVSEGVAEKASIELTMTEEDFIALTKGELNGQQAFLTGKLKIKGDMTLAMKLQNVFNIG
ncbi:MAG: SCP2 sterol-binding domain-containing protein [Candidatus Hydrogenedentes bacterium]|nr:SCP2 sterol-binding domain-containing protein [Candidatus Hydrogenedentota bacterium]